MPHILRLLVYSIVLVVGAMLSGCKTQPPMKYDSATDTTIATEKNTDVNVKTVEELKQEMQKYYSSWRETLTDITATWQRDEYSPPDSMGQQHLTATITGNINSNTREEQKDTSIVQIDLTAVNTEIKAINERLSVMEHTVNDIHAERKSALNWWQTALLWVGGISVGIVIEKLIWRKIT